MVYGKSGALWGNNRMSYNYEYVYMLILSGRESPEAFISKDEQDWWKLSRTDENITISDGWNAIISFIIAVKVIYMTPNHYLETTNDMKQLMTCINGLWRMSSKFICGKY